MRVKKGHLTQYVKFTTLILYAKLRLFANVLIIIMLRNI
jgi:hypothetical protein